ncbi:methylamine utilization protein [Pseudoalteromonas sp. T1lg23B]|uniref:methylamine utilization protein n=1 Tax=Pseudoalteromonas sp. T1lg23B TaxID=2077097 RepID=UPI001F411B24|nr:methylamine utilization protein [Pseudoalteromonas sp. T1lg23B]
MPFFALKDRLIVTLSTALLGCASIAVSAKTLIVVDQHGSPVNNAVVELLNVTTDRQPTKQIAIMDQVNKQFSPKLLTVMQGQQVSFPNSDDIRHHVYSFSEAKPFELKLYAGTPKAPITFGQAGVVVLGCNIHDSMVGYIYVGQSSAVLVSDEQGKIDLPDHVSEYLLWHPEQAINISERTKMNWPDAHTDMQVTIELVAPMPRNTFGEKFKEHHGQ